MTDKNSQTNEVIDCGLIMPIAPMKSYSSEQIIDVKSILKETISEITKYTFNVRMVSDSKGEVDIIHKNIVNNLYEDAIVICDVSGSNPNVLFELGMRLAFDKPTIIIKDDQTKYMFDTSMIEHLEYPSDLRYNKLLDFKKSLKNKLVKTYEASLHDSKYSPFLKHFKNIQVKNIESSSIDVTQAIETIMEDINLIKANQSNYNSRTGISYSKDINPRTGNSFSKDVSDFNLKSVIRDELVAWIEQDLKKRGNMGLEEIFDRGLLPDSISLILKTTSISLDEVNRLLLEAQEIALSF